MTESFEVILENFSTSAVIERNTESSEVCVTWYNIVKGEKQLREKHCEEKMTHEEFVRFRNMMRCYNKIIE